MKVEIDFTETRIHRAIIDIDEETYTLLDNNDISSDEIAGEYANQKTLRDGYFNFESIRKI